jgi:hypothetical protein
VCGTVACSLVGAILGKAALAHPLGALACGLVGFAVGEFIEREIVPRCAVCEAILQMVAAAV